MWDAASRRARICRLSGECASRLVLSRRSSSFVEGFAGFGCIATLARITRRRRSRLSSSVLGARDVERYIAPLRTLLGLREQGRDDNSSELGRLPYRRVAVSRRAPCEAFLKEKRRAMFEFKPLSIAIAGATEGELARDLAPPGRCSTPLA